MDGVLILEDGRRFVGQGFGARTSRVGEAVFNTSLTGYQEILTDPSYAEQIITMTASQIGNTGVNDEDAESDGILASGFVVRELSPVVSNWRAKTDLPSYLEHFGVPGLTGIDTRALVRHIRDRGAMKAVISTSGEDAASLEAKIKAWPGMNGRALATEVGPKAAYEYATPAKPAWRIAVLDGGCKRSILQLLAETGAYVRVHPLSDPASAWTRDVDAIFIGNGPGDPAALGDVIEKLSGLVGQIPLLGICLGHQLLSLALGARTYKLKYGHRGSNHPVRDERTGRVEITSQNHGFAVDATSLLAVGARITHTHLNDQTVSGFDLAAKRIFAVQYHPESDAGPHDSRYLFDQFRNFVVEGR